MTTMRVNLKHGAVAAAATFLLLLILHLTWPGHGVWSLVVGVLIGLTAASLWWRDRFLPEQRRGSASHSTPFADVGAYGLAGASLSSARQTTSGVPLSLVLAPISALAILLFVGGAIGSSETLVQDTVTTLGENVTAIDRSRDGQPATPEVAPPAVSQTQQTQPTSTVTAVSSSATSTSHAESTGETQRSTTPVKPIVVAAPAAAAPAGEENEAAPPAPESANTIEYVVEEGDTLYDIAESHNSTVDSIISLNDLDSFSFIHPGDVLLIPLPDDEPE